MTDLGSSIREYAAFIDEVAIEHRGPLPTGDPEPTAPAEDVAPAPFPATVTPIDAFAGEADAASPRRGRLLVAAAAVVAMIVGVVGIVGLQGDPAPNVEAVSPGPDDEDTIVEVEPAFPERDRAISAILDWFNGDVSPAEVESLLGVEDIPDRFFAESENAQAAGRPFTVERTTMLTDRSETIIEAGTGGRASLTIDYDGTVVSSVELMPIDPEVERELTEGVALIDEQLRWLAGEEAFTELDYVRRHVGLAIDSYTDFVATVEEISAGDPYDTVVYRAFAPDGSGAVLLQRAGGGLLYYGALIEDGRLLALVERSDG